MNSINLGGKNYIFVSSTTDDYVLEFIKETVTLVKKQKVALIFLRTHVDFLPALVGLNKKQMQNLIISYQSDLDAVVAKLLELHNWAILPDFVLVHLNAFFQAPNTFPALKSLCLCIATLFSYLRVVEKQKRLRGKINSCVNSLLLLNSRTGVQMKLIIDFYFYKSVVYSDFEAMKNEILRG